MNSLNNTINPFEKYQSKDNKVTAYTTENGIVIKKIAGKRKAIQSGKIIHSKDNKGNDYAVYYFSIPAKYIMKKYRNGVGINYAFFDTFANNSIFHVTVTNENQKSQTFAISKTKALKFGIVASERNYEQQIFIPICFFEKLS